MPLIFTDLTRDRQLVSAILPASVPDDLSASVDETDARNAHRKGVVAV